MTTLTTKHGNFIAVNVPEAKYCKYNSVTRELVCMINEGVYDIYYCRWVDVKFYRFMLPPGQYEFIGISDSMTEEQAHVVVEHLHRGSYYENLDDPFSSCATAKECFATWLRANNVAGRVAILKCIDNQNEEKC